MAEIAIYVEKVLYPAVWDILQGALKQFPEVTNAYLWTEDLDRTVPTLVLGNLPEVLPINYVKTLSQKQILSNPATITELNAAITQLLTPAVFPKMDYTVLDRPLTDVEEARLGPVLVVDIETGGDIKLLVPQELWLISLAINDGRNIYVFTEEALRNPAVIAQLIRLFTGRRKLIAHNMKFDFRTLTEVLGVPIFGHLDTMLLHHAINPGAKEHGLKPLCKKYLGAEEWEGATSQYVKGKYKVRADGTLIVTEKVYYPAGLLKRGIAYAVGYEAIPRELLYEYNAYDVYWTWYLYEYLAKAAAGDPRIMDLARYEFRMANFFQEVESNGLAVDMDYLDTLDKKLKGEMAETLDNIRFLTSSETFNPNSPPQVKEVFTSLGIDLKSTAEDVLTDLLPTLGPTPTKFVELLLEYRGFSKEHGTYVKGLLKRERGGMVFPTFKVHGTNTGRLSSADPNVQNIPRDEDDRMSLRRIFVPRAPGRSLVSVDYSQAELRVMACMSNDEYLISLFQPGMPDFFDSLMPTAFPNVDLDALDKSTKKNMRAKLKGVIYGMSYGRKEFAIAKALDMPVKEAKSIITNYFRAAPALYDWRQWVEERAVHPDYTLVSPFGRYYQSEVVTNRNKQNVINAGLAFLPQSTASDFCVMAAMDVHEQLKASKSDAKIIATIHDAILMDVPDEDIQWVSDLTQKAMEDSAFKVFKQVPFATEATVGSSWEGI